MFDFELFTQILLSGVVIGLIYALMAVGITFIYSIMKMINWSMGEYYMLGSYLQFVLVAHVFGRDLWYLGIPLTIVAGFVLGVFTQRLLLKPMYEGEAGRRGRVRRHHHGGDAGALPEPRDRGGGPQRLLPAGLRGGR